MPGFKKKQSAEASPKKGKSNEILPYIIEAVFEIFLALVIFIGGEKGTGILCTVIGILLLGLGVFNIYHYIVGKFSNLGLELLSGAVMAGLGVVLIFQSQEYSGLFLLILLFLLAADSLVDIRRSLTLMKHEFSLWYLLLGLSCAVLLLDLLLYFAVGPFGTYRLQILGGIFIYEAVTTVISTICLLIISHREKHEKIISDPVPPAPKFPAAPDPAKSAETPDSANAPGIMDPVEKSDIQNNASMEP